MRSDNKIVLQGGWQPTVFNLKTGYAEAEMMRKTVMIFTGPTVVR